MKAFEDGKTWVLEEMKRGCEQVKNEDCCELIRALLKGIREKKTLVLLKQHIQALASLLVALDKEIAAYSKVLFQGLFSQVADAQPVIQNELCLIFDIFNKAIPQLFQSEVFTNER